MRSGYHHEHAQARRRVRLFNSRAQVFHSRARMLRGFFRHHYRWPLRAIRRSHLLARRVYFCAKR